MQDSLFSEPDASLFSHSSLDSQAGSGTIAEGKPQHLVTPIICCESQIALC